MRLKIIMGYLFYYFEYNLIVRQNFIYSKLDLEEFSMDFTHKSYY